jgi:hypothetical protein
MRNYQKERAWLLNNYKEVRANIKKELAEEFRKKLKKERITVAEWMTEKIEDYLEEK